MAYQSSVAYRLSAVERERHLTEDLPQRSFEVIEGAGLDARAHQGVSPRFAVGIRVVFVLTVLLFVVGLARVGITAATAAQLKASVNTRNAIVAEKTALDERKIQYSVLSNDARISRIATQDYGMVKPDTVERVTVDNPAAPAKKDKPSG